MADIDSIIAGVSGNTRYDFSTFGDPVKTYFDVNKQRAEKDLRESFKGGVPLGPDGQPDFGAMARTLYQHGGLEQGNAAANLDLQRQSLRLGQEASAKMERAEGGGTAPQPTVGPSTSRNTVSPDPGKRMDASNAPAPSQPRSQATVMTVLDAQGIPNDQLGAASASVARQLGINPNDPIDINDPKVRGVLIPAVQQLKRMGVGQVIPEGQPSPPPQVVPQQPGAQPAPAAPNPQVNQGTFGAPSAIATRGAVPTGADPEIQKQIAMYTSIASNPAYPKSVQEAAKSRLEALQRNAEPTGPMKEYDFYRRQGGNLPFNEWQADTEQRKSAAQESAKQTNTIREYNLYKQQGGTKTFEDWQNRTDENTSQRDILTKSILPKLDKSQETAQASRDDIQAIHRSREQLDEPGGIFSGAGADKLLKVAKVAEYLGVPNANKIANTEAFGAAIGSRVLTLVKGLGAGTGISNADRDFASGMAGGSIKLDEQSIRKILDIGEKAARAKIDQHNGFVDRTLKASDQLQGYKDVYRVEAPGEYAKAASDPYAKARAAIQSGAPREAVMQRLKQFGHDPSKL